MSLLAPTRRDAHSYSRVRPRERDALVVLTMFLAMLFLLPARFVIAAAGAAGRPALLVGLGAFGLWGLYRLIPDETVRRRQPMRWAIGFYVIAICAAYLFGIDRGMPGVEARGADREMLLLFSLAGIALVAMDGLPTPAALQRLLLRLNYGAAGMAAVGTIQFLTGFDLTRSIHIPGIVLNRSLIIVGSRGTGEVPRVAGTAGHYIEFGVVLGMMLPLAIHYARFADTPRERRSRWLAVIIIGVGIPFSVSRAGAVSAALALLVSSISWNWRLRFNGFATLFFVVVCLRVIKPGLIGTIRSLFTNLDNDTSISARTADYAFVGQYISERPWFGRGPGTFLPDEYVLLDNQWIGQVVATGYVGAVAFAAVFITALCLLAGIKHHCQDPATRDLAQALAGTVIAAGITSFFFDSMSFAIFGGVIFTVFGAIGALWQVADFSAPSEDGVPAHSAVPAPALR